MCGNPLFKYERINTKGQNMLLGDHDRDPSWKEKSGDAMKKVYGSIKALIFCAVAIYLGVITHELWVIGCFAFAGCFFMFWMFRPVCEYNDEKIAVHHVFKTYEHRWQEVVSMETLRYWPMTWVEFDNGGQLILGSLMTRHYSLVLKDLMETAQNHNSNVVVDENTKKYADFKYKYHL